MFLVNDTVVYGNSEVCQVKEIKVPEFMDSNEPYYFLQPYYKQNFNSLRKNFDSSKSFKKKLFQNRR
jgi:hypothetical protein